MILLFLLHQWGMWHEINISDHHSTILNVTIKNVSSKIKLSMINFFSTLSTRIIWRLIWVNCFLAAVRTLKLYYSYIHKKVWKHFFLLQRACKSLMFSCNNHAVPTCSMPMIWKFVQLVPISNSIAQNFYSFVIWKFDDHQKIEAYYIVIFFKHATLLDCWSL